MTHMCLALARGWEGEREGEVGWKPRREVEAEPGDCMAEETVVSRLPVSGLMSSGLCGPPKVAASSKFGSSMDMATVRVTFNRVLQRFASETYKHLFIYFQLILFNDNISII